MRLLICLALLFVLSAIAPADPNTEAPFVTVKYAEPEGGTMDGRVRVLGCRHERCEVRVEGDWTITTRSGTIAVHGGFLAEPSP